LITLTCIVCGTKFEGKRKTALYCSCACKTLAYRWRHGQHLSEDQAKTVIDVRTRTKICPCCGHSFGVRRRGRAAKFCSDRCRKAYNRGQRKAAQAYIKATFETDYIVAEYCRMATPALDEFIRSEGRYYNHAQRSYVYPQFLTLASGQFE